MPNYKSDLWASVVDLVNHQVRTNASSSGGVNALYVSTATTYSSGATGTLWIDENGNLKAREQYAPGYEDNVNNVAKTEQRFNYTALTSITTLSVKGAAGFLHRVVVGMPSCPTITLYDSLTPTGTEIIKLHAGYPTGSHEFNMVFSTGLSVSAIGTGAVIPNITLATR